MKKIDLSSWDRKEHYEYFRGMELPFFSISGNIDITGAVEYSALKKIPLFNIILYSVSRAVNDIPEMRLRIRGEEVVSHEATHPSFTMKTGDGLFCFCTVPYSRDPSEFFRALEKERTKSSSDPDIDDEGFTDELIYITVIPWISFSSITHPVGELKKDSIPRISWGKYIKNGEVTLLPFAVHLHHALCDGSHAGRLFNDLEKMMGSSGERPF